MPAFFSVDPHGGAPIYVQLSEQIKRAIALGALRPGEQLPTVKTLAHELKLNPNTIARVYRELERDGTIATAPGRGSFVRESGVLADTRRCRDRRHRTRARRRGAGSAIVGRHASRGARAGRRLHRPLVPGGDDVIAIGGLTKRYGGVAAIDDLTLEVPAGSVCGLLGRNGAGKTTTFKCLLGFTRPDRGEIRFDGEPLSPRTFAKLGYVPERAQLYRWLTVAEHVELVRRTQPNYDAAYARELLATFRLDSAKRAGRLSKGQQTALALVVALAPRPSLLLLDEPASGLDPVLQRAVIDLLIDAATAGATVLLSSHHVGQIERAADRVAIVRDGRLVLAGEIDALRDAAKIIEATFDDAVPDLTGLPGVTRLERAGTTVRAYAERRERGGRGAARWAGRARRAGAGPLARRPVSRSRRRRRRPLMEYVAILRARRVLFWFAVGALVVEVLVVSFLYQVTRFPRARTTIHRVAPAQLHPGAAHDTVRAHRGGVRVAGHHPIRTADTPMVIAASPHRGRHAAREPGSFGYSVSRAGDVWLSALLGIAAYAPLLLAPFLALGLDAEYRTAAIAWTRPTARLAIAGRYLAVDALALLLGWLGAVGLVTIAMGILGWGGHLVVDGFVPAMLFVGLAAPVLWYGLIVADLGTVSRSWYARSWAQPGPRSSSWRSSPASTCRRRPTRWRTW